MEENQVISWMLEGDVSVQYLVHKLLFQQERPDLQQRIATEGWGASFLEKRKPQGHWGDDFYMPKWTSTHYTLLDLRNIALPHKNKIAGDAVDDILEKHKGSDGGINPAKTISLSDVCINGMFVNYATWFGADETKLHSVIDFILSQKMADGGFNCRSNRSGARHSSLHTTLSVLEGILGYYRQGYTYRIDELLQCKASSEEFILEHKLFRSSTTGEIIDKRMLMLSWPCRWRYDILRALEYFAAAGSGYDIRMLDALEILQSKQRKDGKWAVQARHPGEVHFEMEATGKAGRMNTLRAIFVLHHFGNNLVH